MVAICITPMISLLGFEHEATPPQSKIYMKQNPTNVNSIQELRAMVGRMSSIQLMNRLQKYSAKTHSQYQDLKALLHQKAVQPFSSLLAVLIPILATVTLLNAWPSQCLCTCTFSYQQSSPTDWFFHAKLSDFIEHLLHETLDVEWFWYKYILFCMCFHTVRIAAL